MFILPARFLFLLYLHYICSFLQSNTPYKVRFSAGNGTLQVKHTHVWKPALANFIITIEAFCAVDVKKCRKLA